MRIARHNYGRRRSLEKRIGHALDVFTAEECANYSINAGCAAI
jgi:hypothetical protein